MGASQPPHLKTPTHLKQFPSKATVECNELFTHLTHSERLLFAPIAKDSVGNKADMVFVIAALLDWRCQKRKGVNQNQITVVLITQT